MNAAAITHTHRNTYPRLVGDIGGTHARFAMVLDAEGSIQNMTRYRCEEFATLGDAITRYLFEHARDEPRTCALGVATAITGDFVQLTNHAWHFSIRALQEQLRVDRLLVLNDFEALALSLPALPATELRQVGSGVPALDAPIGLIGPGTGLGVSGLLPVPGGRGQVAIGGEGGHVTLSSIDPEEAAVIQWLQRVFGHASAERALSGPGLENIYQAVRELAGYPRVEKPADEITQAALAGTEETCVKTLNMFCSLLGSVAGNVALTLGARGGVYIGGGIVPQLGKWFDTSPFRERFESKGRFREYLSAIPTYVVQSAGSPALIGASRALDRAAD